MYCPPRKKQFLKVQQISIRCCRPSGRLYINRFDENLMPDDLMLPKVDCDIAVLNAGAIDDRGEKYDK